MCCQVQSSSLPWLALPDAGDTSLSALLPLRCDPEPPVRSLLLQQRNHNHLFSAGLCCCLKMDKEAGFVKRNAIAPMCVGDQDQHILRRTEAGTLHQPILENLSYLLLHPWGSHPGAQPLLGSTQLYHQLQTGSAPTTSLSITVQL